MVQEFDWNLLVTLDVLLAEGSVTGAASRFHLSVPATSHALSRIRRAFDDPMLVRAGRGLVPTPRALAVQSRLHQLIEEGSALFEIGRRLDLGALERTFTIRANDALTSQIVGRLVERVRAAAPGIALRFVPEGLEDVAPLRDGLIDIDLGVIDDFGPEVRTEPLFVEHYVGLVAPGHPLAKGRMSLRRLCTVDHIAVSRQGRLRGAFDDALAEHGLARRVVASVPTFTAAAQIIVGSAMTGLVVARYAHRIADATGAHVFPIPVDLPSMTVSQAWHVRNDLDPAHLWLRGQISAVTNEG